MGPNGELPPLGNVLHQVCDKDKNNKVTMTEINTQLSMLEGLFGNIGADLSPDDNEYQYMEMFNAVKASAPTIFKLLDSNNDDSLTKDELSYITKFEMSLKKGGGMRELLRDVFAIIDSNSDELLSVDELKEASASDDSIGKISERIHTLFPLRKSSSDLQDFVQRTMKSIDVSSADDMKEKGMAWIDTDNDGYISRKEVGAAYNTAGKKFLEVSKTIKQMGPMLAMFDAGGVGRSMGGMPRAGGPVKTEF